MDKITVLAVVGPTASGKTALGIELAKKYNGEVVSADSMQIYRYMDIATAKPTKEEMGDIPHHLIDFVEPEDKYSVARYVEDATRVIDDIISRGKMPVIVGGTGLYIDSLLGGIAFNEQPENDEIRAELQREAAEKGNEAMHDILKEIDPEYAKTLHPNNSGRVIRAIELFRLTGLTMTQQLENSRKQPSRYNPVMLGIGFDDREKLYERINLRVDLMLKDGILDEVKEFYEHHDAKTAAQAIGCKEFLPYISGEKSLEECVFQLKQSTRRYAKRQLTWFRRNEAINWLYRDRFEGFDALLEAAFDIVDRNL
ncbi:MAG: tRNA (adenosine(37)-N6)-dimethylallyltransferase MiaA [Oscillospiraceae bacterium]|nr:tRNA (adenosine(37)-N6)-dimethylallyltransferase MiaA [Oscillospiraceae bacterium]